MYYAALRYGADSRIADDIAVFDTDDFTVERVNIYELIALEIKVENFDYKNYCVENIEFLSQLSKVTDYILLEESEFSIKDFTFTFSGIVDSVHYNGKSVNLSLGYFLCNLSYVFMYLDYLVLRFKTVVRGVWHTVVLDKTGVVADWKYNSIIEERYFNFGDKSLMMRIDMTMEV